MMLMMAMLMRRLVQMMARFSGKRTEMNLSSVNSITNHAEDI